MTFNEVFEGFKSLNSADKRRLLESGNAIMKTEAFNLRYGAKVQFKVRGGGFIAGTFMGLKRKNAEVMSLYGKYGMKAQFPMRWRVSPELLIPLTADQVKLHEFP